MKLKELRDLLVIYDREDDDYEIKIWNPTEQKELNFYFTGSSKIDRTINFNADYKGSYRHWKWELLILKLKLELCVERLIKYVKSKVN